MTAAVSTPRSAPPRPLGAPPVLRARPALPSVVPPAAESSRPAPPRPASSRPPAPAPVAIATPAAVALPPPLPAARPKAASDATMVITDTAIHELQELPLGEPRASLPELPAHGALHAYGPMLRRARAVLVLFARTVMLFAMLVVPDARAALRAFFGHARAFAAATRARLALHWASASAQTRAAK